uniref:Uncharacterized protein TCIL3000_11_11540 n=1 Tax=Trypanosoma congolense (strain IL3000) TaxID=1068625 RepID=G0V1Z2_TRYCI|nr:unnamed protein product [Trypanosoma congolense IL3000]
MGYPGWKTFTTVGKTAVGVFVATNSLLIAYARYRKDTFFLKHWDYGKPIMMKKTSSLALWEQALSAGERACVQAWLDAMNFQPPSTSLFLPSFVLQDTLMFVCGLSEWRRAILLIRKLSGMRPTTYCMEIRRETQGNVIFLHVKLETELRPWFLPGSMEDKGPVLLFPSVVTLQLESNQTRDGKATENAPKWRIAAAEHRWFGGPIASQQTSTLRSPWGDVADITRRFFTYTALSTVGALFSDNSY